MRISPTKLFSSTSLAAAVVVALSLPAFAQMSGGSSDPFAGAGAGSAGTSQATGQQVEAGNSGSAAQIPGTQLGIIGPKDQASVIEGLNTGGTVRVNNLANLEALLNIIANGMEILGIAWGGPTMIMGFMHMAAGTQDAMKRVLYGAAGVTGGLATPGCINWLVASAKDANLFS